MTPLLLLALACADEGDDTGPGTTPPPGLDAIHAGAAPWDGFTTDESTDWVPVVQDAEGQPVNLAIHSFPAYREGHWSAPSGELPAGSYTVTGFEGGPQDAALGFTVGSAGRDAGFDPARVAGTAWALASDPDDADPGAVLFVALDASQGELLFLVDRVEGEAADFRVLYRDDRTACLALEGQGTLSATGEFTWSADRLEVSTTPALVAQDLHLRLGFTADGTALAGAEAWTTVDLGALSAWVDEEEDPGRLCESWSDLGGVCAPCTADQDPATCATLGFRKATGTPMKLPLFEELPDCQAVFEEDLLPGCACATGAPAGAGGLSALGLLALARRRRRAPRAIAPRPPGGP